LETEEATNTQYANYILIEINKTIKLN